MSSRPHLSREEADAFLEHLFGGLAVKPKRIALRQTAGVVRYLTALAYQTPFGRAQELVASAAELLWRALLSVGEIRIAEKQQVIECLVAHRRTYLQSLDMERLLKLVTDRAEPGIDDLSFRPSQVMGRDRSVSGQSKNPLQDDLTERIYVAYHALHRVGVKNVRGHIVQVLNRLGIETRARASTSRKWTPAEVAERVRQFDDRLLRLHKLRGRPDRLRQLAQRREKLVDNWMGEFQRARLARSTKHDRNPG